MNDSPIISTHDLAKLLSEKTLRIIDCRFNLGDSEWGQKAYLQGHIPGAIYAHLNLDLSGPVSPNTGRHPLPEAELFLKKLAGWGISPETLVVVYDTVGGAFASRLWFMLRAVNHKQVKSAGWRFAKMAGRWISAQKWARGCFSSRNIFGLRHRFQPTAFGSHARDHSSH